jgi:hypothetical protein
MQASAVQLRDAILTPVEGDKLPTGLTEAHVCPLDMRDKVAALLREKAKKKNKREEAEDFILRFGKKDILGGGGGTQVCGGING